MAKRVRRLRGNLAFGASDGLEYEFELSDSDSQIRPTGYRAVSSATICVLTHLRMRHWWDTAMAFIRFRKLRSSSVPGLLRFAFAIESPWEIVMFSTWRDQRAVAEFGSIHEHVRAVRWTFLRAREIWSAEWGLRAVSPRLHWSRSSTQNMGIP
jgi:hypothetical protein